MKLANLKNIGGIMGIIGCAMLLFRTGDSGNLYALLALTVGIFGIIVFFSIDAESVESTGVKE